MDASPHPARRPVGASSGVREKDDRVVATLDDVAPTGRLVGSEAHPKIPSVDMEGTLG